MKSVFHIGLACLLLTLPVRSQPKYGFLAESDEALLALAQKQEVYDVVLVCVYRFQPLPEKGGKDHMSQATVIESYKGRLKIGQQIAVTVYAESGPSQEKELGRLRFFVLRESAKPEDPGALPSFTCDWTDSVTYSEYGESMRKVLRDGLKEAEQ
jgi:hypothetical protein